MKINLGAGLLLLILGASPVLAESHVSLVEGDVTIVRGAEKIKAVEGLPLQPADIVETGTGARTDISLNGSAGFRLLEQSRAEIPVNDSANIRVRAELGNILVRIKEEFKNQQGRFTLETPTVVAAVRGTQFWGRVGNTGVENMTTLAVREGIVHVTLRDSGKEVDLNAGEAVDLADSSIDIVVRKAVAPELQALEQAEQIVI